MITNARTVSEDKNAIAAGIAQPVGAHGSRTGEDNSVHIFIAVVGLGVLAVVAGWINVKVAASTSVGN